MRILNFLNQNPRNSRLISRPYLIAEAGVNHEGSMDLAKRLIEEAAEAGADAIKFQTYKADTIASKDSPYYWDISKEPTRSQHELFQKYDKFWKTEFEQLKKCCDQFDIEFMSTPFDIESADFLNEMMDCFKISSSDLTNKPFIQHMCSYGKPVILSTGASHLHEIHEAVSWIEEYSNPLILMHCVLNYPTPQANAHLGMITHLKEQFPQYIIGYSDHTLPGSMDNLVYANLLGARVIEKHFTFDKSLPGNDHYHAMDKEDLKLFVKKQVELQTVLGSFNIQALESENKARRNARRSLIIKRNLPKGYVLTTEDLTFKRPAFGISPKDIDVVVGMTTSREIQADEILYWNMIGEESS